jgi:hypothetical protein
MVQTSCKEITLAFQLTIDGNRHSVDVDGVFAPVIARARGHSIA